MFAGFRHPRSPVSVILGLDPRIFRNAKDVNGRARCPSDPILGSSPRMTFKGTSSSFRCFRHPRSPVSVILGLDPRIFRNAKDVNGRARCPDGPILGSSPRMTFKGRFSPSVA